MDAKDDDDVRNIIQAESLYQFDLMNPPVVRGVLVRLSCSHEYLLINQHHIGSDGWSSTILRRQLLKLYHYFPGDDKDSDILSIPIHPSYVDFTIWPRRWLLNYRQQYEMFQMRILAKIHYLLKLFLLFFHSPMDGSSSSYIGN